MENSSFKKDSMDHNLADGLALRIGREHITIPVTRYEALTQGEAQLEVILHVCQTFKNDRLPQQSDDNA